MINILRRLATLTLAVSLMTDGLGAVGRADRMIVPSISQPTGAGFTHQAFASRVLNMKPSWASELLGRENRTIASAVLPMLTSEAGDIPYETLTINEEFGYLSLGLDPQRRIAIANPRNDAERLQNLLYDAQNMLEEKSLGGSFEEAFFRILNRNWSLNPHGPPVVAVSKDLAVNAVRVMRRDKTDIILLQEYFVRDLLETCSRFPEVTAWLLAERLFHEMGHAGPLPRTSEEKILSESFQVLRDIILFKRAVFRRPLYENIRTYFRIYGFTFQFSSGNYFDKRGLLGLTELKDRMQIEGKTPEEFFAVVRQFVEERYTPGNTPDGQEVHVSPMLTRPPSAKPLEPNRVQSRDMWLPALLLHPRVARTVYGLSKIPVVGAFLLNHYQRSLNRHFSGPLREIAQGRQPTVEELRMLKVTLLADPVQRAIIGANQATADQVVQDRIHIMRKAWPGFSDWWRHHFKLGADEDFKIPIDSLWRVYIPLSQWMVQEARKKEKTPMNPNGLYRMLFYGSQGRGKTVTIRALAQVCNAILDPIEEGQAVYLDIDDKYTPQVIRDAMGLRALGYDPGVQGVSNRGPAGTHDVRDIEHLIRYSELSTPDSVFRITMFNKLKEDYDPADTREIRGRVKLFLFSTGFAPDDFDSNQIPNGEFAKRVAEVLKRDYASILKSDALFAFDTPSIEEMYKNREQQEQLQLKQQGRRQMTPEGVRAFVNYFQRKSWWPGVTSPKPSMKNITFYGVIFPAPNRRFLSIERGGRALVRAA